MAYEVILAVEANPITQIQFPPAPLPSYDMNALIGR
jgi:hypothetical protein